MTTKISTDNIQSSSLEVLEGGGGTRVYNTFAQLPLSGVETGDQAFIVDANRLYMWTGIGWFNIGLLNTNPTITSGPNASYILSQTGTPTVLTLIASDPEGVPITWSYQVTSGSLGSTATITQSGNQFTITPSTNGDHLGTFGVTFTASDGINIATAASSFTLRFSALDPLYNQSVLLTATGVNNANNNTFIDSSNNNFTITRVGNPSQGAFSPHSPARWSGLFDGTGDYLSSTVGTSLDVPANTNFTVEGWCYLDARVATRPAIFSNYNSFTTGGLSFWAGHGNSTITQFQVGLSGAFPALNAGTIPYNSWFHWAIVRNGTGSNNITVYVNGTSIGTISSNIAITTTGNNLWLGAAGDAVASAGIDGYMSNFRWVIGTAVYTANFTPPTEPLTAVAGTGMLTLQDNRFIDRSTNNFTITKNGDTIIAPFSPFLPTEYQPSFDGGSAYFDGTDDYFNIQDGTFTNDLTETTTFTVEAWIYVAGGSTVRRYICSTRGTSGGFEVAVMETTNTVQLFYVGGSSITSTPVSINEWNHVAFVRSNATASVYINGQIANTNASFINGTPTDNNTFRIGGSNQVSVGLRPFNGYISDLRIVKGSAIYTGNFATPTAPLTAVANTSLLLNFTNAGVYDQNSKIVIDTVGSARASTDVVKYGNTSIFFNGVGNKLQISNAASLGFGSGDWTFESWVYPTVLETYSQIFDNRSNGSSQGVGLYLRSTTGIAVANNTAAIANGGSISLNSWSHVAFARQSGVIRGFINGTLVWSVADARTYGAAPDATIGNGFGTIQVYTGYMSDTRITKGNARYTANFTPPTAQLGYNNAE